VRLLSDQQGSEEVTDAQSDATRLVVVRIVLADADSTVDEGTLAQTLSVGQADTVFGVLLALRVVAHIAEVGRAVVGDLIAQRAVVALGLVLGVAGFILHFRLAIAQTGTEGAQLRADRSGDLTGVLDVVDFVRM